MTRSLGKDTAADLEKLRQQTAGLTRGTVESIDWVNGLATVNVGGGSVPMPMLLAAPLIGIEVWVAYLGQQPLCLGPIAHSALGSVQSVASGYASVLGDDGRVVSVPYLGGAPSIAARVVMDPLAGGTVLGTLSAEPLGSTPSVPTVPESSIKSFTFKPTSSGNWTGSGYNSISDPYCSDSNVGAYLYGSQIPDSIPNSAVYVKGSLKIYLVETTNRYPSSKANLGRHNRSSKSSGNPSATSTFEIPDCRGGRWVSLPDSWDDNFRLGTARGVSFDHGGYHIYRRAGSENSGVIVGKWRV